MAITLDHLFIMADQLTEEEFLAKINEIKKMTVNALIYLRKYYATSHEDTLASALTAFYKQQNLDYPDDSVFNMIRRNL